MNKSLKKEMNGIDKMPPKGKMGAEGQPHVMKFKPGDRKSVV